MPPRCDSIFLGPDIGLVNVFTFVDETQDCTLSMMELAAVCSDHFQVVDTPLVRTRSPGYGTDRGTPNNHGH